MESSIESETSSAEKKKTSKGQVFKNSWLKVPEFNYWLEPSSDGKKAFCSVCRRFLTCRKSVLTYHAKSIAHVENLESNKNKMPSTSADVNNTDEERSLYERVHAAEIELSAFFTEHNISHTSEDHLISIIKRIFHDSPIAELVLKRKIQTNILVKDIDRNEAVELSEDIEDIKFPIQIDENTTIAEKDNSLNSYGFMHDLGFLHAKVALSKEARRTFHNLNLLCDHFDLANIAINITQEWLYLPHHFNNTEIINLSTLTMEDMWTKILECKKPNGLSVFSNLRKLVDLVLILPHLNAEPERSFPNVTDIVTKK